MTLRQDKIKLLARSNRITLALPEFTASLSDLLGGDIVGTALLDPSETDALVRVFKHNYRKVVEGTGPGYRRFFELKEKGRIFGIADCLARAIKDERGFFLTKLGSDPVSVKMPAELLLQHAASLISLDGDSLSILSGDRTEGFLLDFNQGELAEAFELTAWGDRWPLILRACDTERAVAD